MEKIQKYNYLHSLILRYAYRYFNDILKHIEIKKNNNCIKIIIGIHRIKIQSYDNLNNIIDKFFYIHISSQCSICYHKIYHKNNFIMCNNQSCCQLYCLHCVFKLQKDYLMKCEYCKNVFDIDILKKYMYYWTYIQ